MNDNQNPWRGRAALGEGYGIFKGSAGDTQMHSHWAVQWTISLDKTVTVVTDEGNHNAEVVVIPPSAPHMMQPADVVSFYVEPDSALALALSGGHAMASGIVCLQRANLEPWLSEKIVHADCDALAELLNNAALAFKSTREPRFEQVIEALKEELAQGREGSRDALAEISSLSSSRFSHWFREQAGISFKGYRKWLKLRISLQALMRGESAAGSAYLGGFSDHAHFSRSFSEAFGITISQAHEMLAR